MNNFIKYPSASNIDIAEMFTKDNLVSITGVTSTGEERIKFVELAVLNKDNNFSNEDQPAEKPDYFEIKFKDISIAMDANHSDHTIIINRHVFISHVKEESAEVGTRYYMFDISYFTDDGEEIDFEEVGKYWYTN